jgi:hypothetical protein
MSTTNTEVTELSDNHHIPNAQLRICPDAGTASSTSTPNYSPTTLMRFSMVVNAFLNGG